MNDRPTRPKLSANIHASVTPEVAQEIERVRSELLGSMSFADALRYLVDLGIAVHHERKNARKEGTAVVANG